MDVHRLKASDLEAAFRQIVQNIIWNKYKLAAVQCNGIAGLLELDEFLNTRANTLKVHDLWLIALGLANGSVYSEASVLEQLEKIVSSWDILRPIPLVTLTRAIRILNNMSKYALAYDLANKFNFSNGQPEWDVTSFTSEYTTRTLIGLDKYEEACEYINSNSSIGPKIKEHYINFIKAAQNQSHKKGAANSDRDGTGIGDDSPYICSRRLSGPRGENSYSRGGSPALARAIDAIHGRLFTHPVSLLSAAVLCVWSIPKLSRALGVVFELFKIRGSAKKPRGSEDEKVTKPGGFHVY